MWVWCPYRMSLYSICKAFVAWIIRSSRLHPMQPRPFFLCWLSKTFAVVLPCVTVVCCMFYHSMTEKRKKSKAFGSENRRALKNIHTDSEESSQLMFEMQRYLKLEMLSSDESPFRWWRENAKYFPNSSLMTVKYLSSHHLPLESERLHSIGESIYNNKHPRLLPENGEMLVFVKNKVCILYYKYLETGIHTVRYMLDLIIQEWHFIVTQVKGGYVKASEYR